MKGLKSVEFTEEQLLQLDRFASLEGITVEQLIERKMRAWLNRATGKKIPSGQVVQLRDSKVPNK